MKEAQWTSFVFILTHMKRFSLLVIVIILSVASVNAQNSMKDQVSQIESAMADTVKYVVPAFMSGRISYTDGQHSNGIFNIYAPNQSIHYIDEKGEIMELANESDVESIRIGKTVFLRAGGLYIEMVDTFDNVIFGLCKRVEFDDKKAAGYGATSSTTSIKTVGSIMANGKNVYMTTTKDAIVKMEPYIIRKNSLLKPTKSVFLKTFPSCKAKIEEYLASNKVDFSKFEDVKELFVYLHSLDN